MQNKVTTAPTKFNIFKYFNESYDLDHTSH